MLRRIHCALARKKRISDPGMLRDWGWREIASLSVMLMMRVWRGFFVRIRLGEAKGLVLCERAVRLYHPWHIKAGKELNLEEGCEIVGLSKRGIVFGQRCTVGRFASIRPTNVLVDEPGEGLVMGDHSNIGPYSLIGCSGYVEIGNNVLMGHRVTLLAENHCFDRTDMPIKEQGVKRGCIKIEDNCWIGACTTVVSGVTIGHDSIIGAGSVVTSDVPSFSICAGVPARVIKLRTGTQ